MSCCKDSKSFPIALTITGYFRGRGWGRIGCFWFSAVAEMFFFAFFARRPWPKRCFSCFSSFGHGRKLVFRVFYSSAVAERRKWGIFAFPRGWKCRKWVILLFQGVGSAENGVFLLFQGVGNAVFFRFPIKNRNFSAPDGCCSQKMGPLSVSICRYRSA